MIAYTDLKTKCSGLKMMAGMVKEIRIKKSPGLLVRNLVFFQLLVLVGYFLISVLADYGTYYNQFILAQSLSYQIARFIFFILIELLLIVYIFLHWFLSEYIIQPTLLIHENGVVFKRRKSFVLSPPFKISTYSGLFGKIFRHGTVVIEDSLRKKPVVLRHIPDADKYIKELRSLEKAHVVENGRDHVSVDIFALLEDREHENLELKSSLRWDMKLAKVNRAVEKSALKTITAFLNSDGGRVVIGVGDKGEPIGLDYDYASLRRRNADGFEAHFTNIFKTAIGPDYRRHVKLTFHKIAGKEVCVAHVYQSEKPAYLKFDNEEAFYIRTGNTTTALPVSQVVSYVSEKWGET